MKLNLGCNTRIKPGYVNVDKDKYPGVDMVADVSKIELADNSVKEIRASNILEHFSHRKSLDVLKEWYRLLEPAGILAISVPDFDRIIDTYRDRGLCDWVVNLLWGDQEYDGADHRCAFNEDRLTELLQRAGFSEISRVERLHDDEGECSSNISNVDGKFICLNIICVK